jgi:hypothetical protein
MNEYLLRHAIANVWCNPAQDRQFVYRLARLTPRYGVRRTINLFYEKVVLPSTTDYYHVYQIGQVIPKRLGLPQQLRRWLSLAELANDHQLFSDLYVTNGVQFPRHASYIWITPGKNLVVAVKINERIHDLEDTDLYLRVYSNAFYQSARSEGRRFIQVGGITVVDENQLLTFQRDLVALVEQEGGFPYYYVNGRFVSNISLATAMVGDVVEYVLDGSIKRVVDFNIDELPSFISTLDAGRKYILHYDDPSVDTIEYLDDVDVYLIHPGVSGRFMGVYYHHNEGDWLRMLTHKDYSIPVERLTGFVRTHQPDYRHKIDPRRWPKDDWTSLSGLQLRVFIRESGYRRPLVADSHRIQELYRLSSDRIVRAMTGIDSSMDLWRAENLERCPYVRFMSADPAFVHPITFNRPDANSPAKQTAQEFVGDVFGYHAAAKVMADTPSTAYSKDGLRYADLAYEHWQNATCFEYDARGVLLEWHLHDHGRHYQVRNTLTAKVETLTGTGGERLNTVFGTTAVTLPAGYNYRLYVSEVWRGEVTGNWRDVTEAVDRSQFGYIDDLGETHRWVWTLDPQTQYGAVRIDDTFLCRELNLARTAGHLRFNITSIEQHPDGEYEKRLDIPFGQLDLYLNGRPLIEGLDYQVQWPEVVISNLEYLVEGTQKVLYRGYGFCQSDFSRLPVSEFGFVEYGVLSNDHRYDIHTHKVRRVVVDGHYRDPADLVFDEQRNDLRIADERNGAPYCIQTPPVVFREVYPVDRAARQLDDERDRKVSDYMTEYFPPRVRTEGNFIETQYHVFSVFANKLLHDLREGHFYPEGIEDQYGEVEIRQWCKPYEWLLPYDICNQDYDDVHVQVWPHWFGTPVELDLYQYTFFARALAVYLRKRPDLAPFIQVVSQR